MRPIHLLCTSTPQRTKRTTKRMGLSQRPNIVLTVALILGTAVASESAHAQKPGADPILQAMQVELDRERAGLFLPGMDRPYFIEYRLDDIVSYEAVANYGALSREEQNHQRVVRVTVRIGSYTADSSSSRGDGSVQLAPQEDNPEGLRYALWLATDEAYKTALRAYSAKQAALKQFESLRKEQDFAAAKPVTDISPILSLDLDREEWKRRIVEGSGLYATAPEVRSFANTVQYSTTNIRGFVLNRYLVNSEGTIIRHGYTGYNAAVSIGGQANDGMRLGRDNGTVATTASELESSQAFHQRIIDDLKSFHSLRSAPLVSADDYHGPVLFSGDASADVLNRLFVPNVEADRPELGTTARTQGAYNSSLHARVLPEILSASDNPLLTTFEGKHLLGSYAIDDEGVPAQSVDVVTAGKLQNYLIGREPVRDFPSSNGHGRAAPGQAAHSRSAVMIFKSSQPLTTSEINEKLLSLAREQKRDVYAVETLGDLVPRVLYLIHPDGSRQLVRGAVFDELDNRSLRSSVIAAGGDPYLSQSLGAVPQTTISPALLFDDIGVKRAAEEQQKLPYYAPPPGVSRSAVSPVELPTRPAATLLSAYSPDDVAGESF